MSEIKYEAVFGPQELFDGANDDAVLAIKDTTSGRIHFFTNDGWIKSGLKHERHIGTSDNQIAMRRIIKEPKRWTLEDKKAGRLPEVGSLVKPFASNPVPFLGVDRKDHKLWVFQGGVGFVFSCLAVRCEPVETPAEKAQRLKSEWCAKAAKQLKNLEYTSTLTSIYDAMLSGELQAPKGE